MQILEMIELAEKLVPVINKLYDGIQKSIEDAKELSPQDKEQLINRIKKAQKEMVTWDEL